MASLALAETVAEMETPYSLKPTSSKIPWDGVTSDTEVYL